TARRADRLSVATGVEGSDRSPARVAPATPRVPTRGGHAFGTLEARTRGGWMSLPATARQGRA
ncbi:MAG: hypothetical protein QF438_04375, partial [Phycisphaerales bacterium]|nr:hypothetical protein [Phycisphaerales bacterium]